MEIDDDGAQNSIPSTSNALAGPSTIPDIFLLPPVPSPAPQSHLRSTQDLLARFQLLPAYDKYVRPYVKPIENGQHNVPPLPLPLPPPPPPASSDKGKGKEREKDPTAETSPAAQSPGADGAEADDDDATGPGEKKKKNNYKHLIKGVPGKHSMKKDDYLMTIMQVPPKQRISITPFDSKTQREAFSVSLDGLKGWNPSTLILESAQAREDRKKRKELKKLAKAQALLPSTSTTLLSTSSAPNPISAHITTSTTLPTRTATPKPGIPRPGSRQAASTVAGVIRTPGTMPLAVYTSEKEKRGKKREHQEVVLNDSVAAGGVGADVEMNGEVSINGTAPRAVVNAKEGVVSGRPRPIKKQRMDIHGQARETVPVQQPTPQGV